jgi:GxxExxY protein
MRDQSYIEWANSISQKIIEAGMEVHKTLGPGLLESIYENCLAFELGLREVRYERQIPVPVFYKNMLVGRSFRLDLVVENAIIVELKTVDRIIPIHEAQLISYLRLSGLSLGLILNFNSAFFRDGIKRMVFNFYR